MSFNIQYKLYDFPLKKPEKCTDVKRSFSTCEPQNFSCSFLVRLEPVSSSLVNATRRGRALI